jgi:hypothetical protein
MTSLASISRVIFLQLFECLDDVVHIAKDKALRLVTNQQAPTPQAIGTWLRRLGKDNQGIKALQQSDFVGVRLFDVYMGENIESGKKSIALNLTYQSLEKTLSDKEVGARIDEVLNLMKNKFSAILR